MKELRCRLDPPGSPPRAPLNISLRFVPLPVHQVFVSLLLLSVYVIAHKFFFQERIEAVNSRSGPKLL